MKLRAKLLGLLFLALASYTAGFITHWKHAETVEEWALEVGTIWYIPIIKVSDGDSLRVKPFFHSSVGVRLIGVDTPESVAPGEKPECFGEEAARYTKELVRGKKAYLSFDPEVGRFDRHGRLLAYVHLSDGTFLNKKLIEDGIAEEWTYDTTDYKHQKEFQSAERSAKQTLRGRWKECGINSEKHPAPKTKKKEKTRAALVGGLFT